VEAVVPSNCSLVVGRSSGVVGVAGGKEASPAAVAQVDGSQAPACCRYAAAAAAVVVEAAASAVVVAAD